MISATFVSALLFTSAMAAPPVMPRAPGCACDISSAQISSLPSGLAAPSHPLSYIGLGVGTQNYTCSAGTYTSAGAVAELYDLSCLVDNPVLFNKIPDVAMAAWTNAPARVTTEKLLSGLRLPRSVDLGSHYFVPKDGGGISPKWDFTSAALKGNADAFVIGAKVANASAPTGPQDVDWLQLKSVSGGLADEVYRTDTRLGQPPASCTPGSADITVKYVSKYWLYGGTVKK